MDRAGATTVKKLLAMLMMAVAMTSPALADSRSIEEIEQSMRKIEQDARDTMAREKRGLKNLSMTAAKLSVWSEDRTKALLRVDNKSDAETYKWTSWNCTASIGSEPPFEQFHQVVLNIPAGGAVYETAVIRAPYDPAMKVNCRAAMVR
jgi:hypothetical protein